MSIFHFVYSPQNAWGFLIEYLHFDGIYSQHGAIYQATQFLLGRSSYNFKKLLNSREHGIFQVTK